MPCKNCKSNVLDLDRLTEHDGKLWCNSCGRVVVVFADQNKSNFRLWLDGRISFSEYVRATMQGEL